jgi:hypothetical protein
MILRLRNCVRLYGAPLGALSLSDPWLDFFFFILVRGYQYD